MLDALDTTISQLQPPRKRFELTGFGDIEPFLEKVRDKRKSKEHYS
jgi:hypothetical protein